MYFIYIHACTHVCTYIFNIYIHIYIFLWNRTAVQPEESATYFLISYQKRILHMLPILTPAHGYLGT